MEAQGWIKMYRKFVDWEWYTDYPVFKLFVHLLLTANHQPKQWRGKTINAGELITSVGSLAEGTGLTKQQIRTALSKLEKTGEIQKKSTNKNTLIIVMNYAIYQSMDYSQQQTSNKRVTIKQQTNNNKQECKNEKNEKKYMQCSTARVRTTPELTGDEEYDSVIKDEYERVPLYLFTPHVIVNSQQEEYLYSNYSLEEVEEEAKKLEAYIVKHDAKPKNVFKTLCEWLERDRAL